MPADRFLPLFPDVDAPAPRGHGRNGPRRILSPEQETEVRAAYLAGARRTALAARYGVDVRTIGNTIGRQKITRHRQFRTAEDLTGQRFGLWTAIRLVGRRGAGQKRTLWWCRCDCGTERAVGAGALKGGTSNQCGCETRARITRALAKHGHTIGKKHGAKVSPEYTAWRSMIGRCLCPGERGYANYGGRGIRVCERWQGEDGFTNFLEDMGYRPSRGHSLDRIDNDGHYEPSNCRWATRKEQCRNTRRTRFLACDGITRPLVEWSELTGLKPGTIYMRIRFGWPVEDAIKTPWGTRRPAKQQA